MFKTNALSDSCTVGHMQCNMNHSDCSVMGCELQLVVKIWMPV